MKTSNLPLFIGLLGSLEVRQFLGGPVPWYLRASQFRQYLRGHPKVGIWVVRDRQNSKGIGLLVLSPHEGGKDYEVSYQFLPSSWGNGYAAEALEPVILHALQDLGFPKIIAETQAANARSCKLLSRLGFKQEMTLERHGAQQIIFARLAL